MLCFSLWEGREWERAGARFSVERERSPCQGLGLRMSLSFYFEDLGESWLGQTYTMQAGTRIGILKERFESTLDHSHQSQGV